MHQNMVFVKNITIVIKVLHQKIMMQEKSFWIKLWISCWLRFIKLVPQTPQW